MKPVKMNQKLHNPDFSLLIGDVNDSVKRSTWIYLLILKLNYYNFNIIVKEVFCFF